ncbi:MAG: hypothetical protein ACO3A4_00805 [Silvanigrellaceae bacterium]
MINSRLKCGTQGDADVGMVGFLAEIYQREVRPTKMQGRQDQLLTHVSAERLLASVESNLLQLAVVNLEQLMDYGRTHPTTSIRILGTLLGGDCRAIVSLVPECALSLPRTLGAAHPGAARARWEDISCAYDLECSQDRAEEVPLSQMSQALLSGQHSLLELNMYWEGLVGYRRGLVREASRSCEFGIPQSFSHVLVANHETVEGNPNLLKEFRHVLLEAYRIILSDIDLFAAQWGAAQVFASAPKVEFLSASARILAPHLEKFLLSGGRLDWHELQSFQKWYDTRVVPLAQAHQGGVVGFSLEQMLCDLWM